MRKTIAAIALLFAAATTIHAATIEKKSITSKGKERTYYLFVPDGVTKEHPAPLIVMLHGSGRDGKVLLTHWQALAQKEGIILAGPESLDRQYWAAPQDGPVMLRDLVDELKSKLPIDERRVYLFGHSAGAQFALQLALIESEYFAAVGIHAGALSPQNFALTDNATRRTPIVMIVGDRDPFFPVADVRATRDHLVKKGFTAELTEIPRHTHDYYSRSPFINEKIWSFLKTRSLEKPQRFTEYANM